MKYIVISTVILILSISFFFGILAFAEWDINPCFWDTGTRVVGAFMFFPHLYSGLLLWLII